MNENEQRGPTRKHLIGVTVYAVIFFLIVALSNLSEVNAFLSWLLDILAPVLIGLCIAYLINPLFRTLERRVFSRVRLVSLRRALSLLLTYVILLAVIAGLILLIIPQLIDSVKTFAGNLNSHLDSLVEQFNSIIGWINGKLPSSDGETVLSPLDRNTVLEKVNGLVNTLLDLIRDSMDSGSISHIIAILGQTASVVTDTILAIFISLYILATKELRYAQVKKFRTAWIPERIDRSMTRILSIADRSFGGFLRGKIFDSSIVGVLVYLFCLIVRIPNPLLIAVIVGITDIVPVIGPFIGVIPSAVIILLTDPIKVVFFLAAILVIQQIDGNIIAPKILGENTGVSSLCVMIAIILMGSLWGLVGMVIGVPLFATVLELLKIWIGRRLDEKGLPNEMENYYARDALSETPESARGVEQRQKRKRKRAAETADQNVGGRGTLSRAERIRLGTLSLATQHGLFSDPTDGALEAFVADTEVFLSKINAPEAAEDTEEVSEVLTEGEGETEAEPSDDAPSVSTEGTANETAAEAEEGGRKDA